MSQRDVHLQKKVAQQVVDARVRHRDVIVMSYGGHVVAERAIGRRRPGA
jgi:hypothetical protein